MKAIDLLEADFKKYPLEELRKMRHQLYARRHNSKDEAIQQKYTARIALLKEAVLAKAKAPKSVPAPKKPASMLAGCFDRSVFAVAIGVTASIWLILCGGLLALFLSFAKQRREFVLYGVFRYFYLVHQRDGGSPTETLLTDRALLVYVVL